MVILFAGLFGFTGIFLKIFTFLTFFLSLIHIIGLKNMKAVANNPSSFKRMLANQYIVFLVSVRNTAVIPDTFVLFNLVLGSFVGRQIVVNWNIPYPNSIIVIISFSVATFLTIFTLVYGVFILALAYPEKYGEILVTWLKNNASDNALSFIGLDKHTSMKRKNLFKQRYYSIKKKRSRRNRTKRRYSTT